MYVRKELDGLKSAIHEGEQPLRLAMAREHRSRMAGLALVTTGRFLFAGHGVQDDPVGLDVSEVEVERNTDLGSISIFAEGTVITLDQFLPKADETTFHTLLTDNRAREIAAAQKVEKQKKIAPPDLKAPAASPPKTEKRCPACSEMVRKAADVCRYCGHDFDSRSGDALAGVLGVNVYAVASLVLGLVWLGGIGSILAVVFANIAKNEIAQTNESGYGMATAGQVLGWIGIVVMVIFFGALCSVTSEINNFQL
jgi:hypothetical protein